METNDQQQQSASKRTDKLLCYGLAFLRVFLAVAPQTGYIHPDEYFQSLEVVVGELMLVSVLSRRIEMCLVEYNICTLLVSGDVFKADRSQIWEFDLNFPIRNVVIPYVIYGIPCLLTKWVLTLLKITGPVSPYLLVIPPRLCICLLSFLVDYSLIK